MRIIWKAIIVAALIAALAVTIALKPRRAPVVPSPNVALPRLLEIGSNICVPCKLMAPVMANLQRQYSGKLQAVVIDIRDDPDARDRYNLDTIPTQIFQDTSGKELFRHIGFMSENEIVARWKALGLDLGGALSSEKKSRVREIFEILNRAITGSLPLALAAAFLWGICTVILSPRHLTSIPLVVAFANGQAAHFGHLTQAPIHRIIVIWL